MKPIIAITMGDINGVGPEIIAKAFARDDTWKTCTPIVIGDREVYENVRANIPDAPTSLTIDNVEKLADANIGCLSFLEHETTVPEYRPGNLDPAAGAAAMEWIARATKLAINNHVDAIVTCPINKQGIHAAGYDVRGHTDFIAEMCGAADYRMCLFTQNLGIIHISDHIPLREAIHLVKRDRIIDSIRIAHDALTRLGRSTRIAVAGLNPHAGEAGAFGREEIDQIAPAIETCRAEGINCSGPHSPDAIFRSALNGKYDLVIAMYHDQGHIPLKLAAMDQGVNVTLGLPIIRTSVDHGTAYDIAGTYRAREHSLCAAIKIATALTQSRQKATS